MPAPATVLLIHFAATWFMTGLIWFVQVVHYPQFANVGTDAFARYHGLHTTLTTRVVGPPMLVELVTALVLLAYRPPGVSLRVAVAGVVMLAIVWGSTALLQVPMHNRLARGMDADVARSLCATNWVRTVGWSMRAVLVAYALSTILPAASTR